MPPPLFDDMQIANALRNDALPALESLARNSALRDGTLARFDRDEPPPYASSTEDEGDEDMPHLTLGPISSSMLDELNALLDEPLDDDQLHKTASFLRRHRVYEPGPRYDEEVRLERGRVESWARWSRAKEETTDYFVQLGPASKGRAGQERVNIIGRRNIRRRWQKLGVWNHEWGIPGRTNNPQPNDDTHEWKWPWQHGDAATEWPDAQHPATRAVLLRQGLRRNQDAPTVPRSRLGRDTSSSQAESFITSRPWFIHQLEAVEESERRVRLPTKMEKLYKGGSVRRRWEKRGDWNTRWQDDRSGEVLIGWKWHHESPSPEPEDLSGLDDLAALELTPSEADALEAVPPPPVSSYAPARQAPPPNRQPLRYQARRLGLSRARAGSRRGDGVCRTATNASPTAAPTPTDTSAPPS